MITDSTNPNISWYKKYHLPTGLGIEPSKVLKQKSTTMYNLLGGASQPVSAYTISLESSSTIDLNDLTRLFQTVST